MVDLGIVIVNWNTADELRKCLETVFASEGDFSYRVVVVDNASSDNSPQMVRDEFPDAELLALDDNLGKPRL
ncbi:MAG: glycosyltransferase, partial [Chloroflexota bacterium]